MPMPMVQVGPMGMRMPGLVVFVPVGMGRLRISDVMVVPVMSVIVLVQMLVGHSIVRMLVFVLIPEKRRDRDCQNGHSR